MARVYVRKDHTGIRYGRLTVVKDLPDIFPIKLAVRVVETVCDCGNVHVVRLHSITSGSIASCGCAQVESARNLCVERNTTHGEAKLHTKEYTAWRAMLSRCYNSKSKRYNYYGGRGIVVEDSWLNSYENFLKDMGRAPSNSYDWSVGRKDNNENYGPENCLWEVWDEQARNRGMQENNTSGFCGVYVYYARGIKHYAATWHDFRTGKRVRRLFSCRKYGEYKAKDMAITARMVAINEMNLDGAGYSVNHGLPRKYKEQNEQT